jgi:spore germination cell wall hydrolase CwlJ-like protein
MALAPTMVAYQDLGALLVHQAGVAQRWREHLIASPFGTIHAATFSMPRPLGTRIPHPPLYALANFDPLNITGAIGAEPLGDGSAPPRYPAVNRDAKRDLLVSRRRAPLPPLPPLLAIEPVPQPEIDAALRKDGAAPRFDPYSQYDFPAPGDESAAADVELPYRDLPPTHLTGPLAPKPAGESAARVYFGASPLAPAEEIAPWGPGEAPVLAHGRSAMKQAALSPSTEKAGESVAAKGVVTGEEARPQSPAERLKLSGASRAKAEKCLANAVYFEARGEPVRGQIAVAQVVMNRLFSPFYPKTVCDVVYQNADRHNSCQFTFACDGIPDIVTEPEAWERAKRISRDMLDGKLWLPEVAKSTHYHAYWVHPSWVGEMNRIYKLGVHTFYRPRNWGDGSDEPRWGDAKTTAKEAEILQKM